MLFRSRVEPTGRASASSTLVTPWFSVPITRGEEFDSQTAETDALPIGGLYVPVRIERVTHRETRVRRERVDEAALTDRLARLALADARSRLDAEGPREFEIARCWTRVDPIANDRLRVSAVCEVYTNTAATAQALRHGG